MKRNKIKYTVGMEIPSQPIGWDATGKVIRFRENELVSYIQKQVALTGYTVNDIALQLGPKFSNEEYWQLSQLGGYSVSGYGAICLDTPDPRLNDYDTESRFISERKSLEDMVVNKPHPVQPFGYSWETVLCFKRNMIIHELVLRFGGLQKVVDLFITEPNSISVSYEDFSQLLQLAGTTEAVFNDSIRQLPEWRHDSESFKPALKAIEDFKEGLDYGNFQEMLVDPRSSHRSIDEARVDYLNGTRTSLSGLAAISGYLKALNRTGIFLLFGAEDQALVHYVPSNINLSIANYVTPVITMCKDGPVLMELKFTPVP